MVCSYIASYVSKPLRDMDQISVNDCDIIIIMKLAAPNKA